MEFNESEFLIETQVPQDELIISQTELVEYKSLRTPISYEEKLKYQLLYDKMRAENNQRIRKVIYT